MRDSNVIHLEYQGINTRVSLQTPLLLQPKSQATTRTDRGEISSHPLTKGINSAIDPHQLNGNDLLENDPELQWQAGGKVLEMDVMTTAYFDPEADTKAPISDFAFFDLIYDAQGKVTDRRPKLTRKANINDPMPIKLGKRLPILQVLNSFVFRHTYQLIHEDGITRDFLFRLAEELDQKQEMVILGAGSKGSLPLVLRDKGSPYRGFLSGEIGKDENEGKYKLLLLLSAQELKLPEKEQ